VLVGREQTSEERLGEFGLFWFSGKLLKAEYLVVC